MTDDARGTTPIALSRLISAYQDPHEVYDRARRESGVAFDPESGCWVVTDHSVVRGILNDSRFSSGLNADRTDPAPARGTSFVQAAMERQILFSDGEEHKRVQSAILHETARRSQELTGGLERLASSILEPLASGSELDLVTDVALPYSMRAICMLMGLPLDDPMRIEKLAEWSAAFAAVTSGHFFVRIQDIALLGEYFRQLVHDRKSSPRDDLIGHLIRDRVFEDEEDLVVNCMVVFAAGRITTQKAIGDGIPYLLPAWKRWREAVLSEPTICRRLTEELLRVVTPTRYLARRALDDVEIARQRRPDCLIRKGEKVILFLEAANRDPASFSDPHRLRADRQPNPHLAFGHGPHRCPGAGVARMEIQVVLKVFFELFPRLRAHPLRAPSCDANPNLGGYTSFPCVLS